ncbi:Receptor L-domain domain-containing protein [Caenorhabditis elegans]|uniref:Receptor L-domain domain-containing protein n=1 Tax=Caenorhabditis elegans TaxID=6239 RepID=Q4W5S6_CAEEL|nr:Receptor L-domain domain-containing protein [Caenorhabditis elegans]CCD73709.1 Receptor L-domain domain-containing protein [Caenorhabditis elegans]|eukprot:NP_001022520.1 Insulin/EGF-Receptor L Domain protein [Caenorhabditis elegans]
MVYLSKSKVQNIHARYCESLNESRPIYPIYFFNLCYYEKLSTLADDCDAIFGDVVVDVNDGRYLYKFFGVGNIFGSLKIQYTKIEGLDFLLGLDFVGSLDASQTPVLIRSNNYLKQAFLLLNNIISANNDQLVMYDNPSLFLNNQQCLMYQIDFDIKMDYRDCRPYIYDN